MIQNFVATDENIHYIQTRENEDRPTYLLVSNLLLRTPRFTVILLDSQRNESLHATVNTFPLVKNHGHVHVHEGVSNARLRGIQHISLKDICLFSSYIYMRTQH